MTAAKAYLPFWECLISVLLAPALFIPPLSASEPQTSTRLTVQVYNWTLVASQVLIAAEHQAARIFHETGVTVSWLNCPVPFPEAPQANPNCIQPCPPTRLAIRIISEIPDDLTKTSLGVALGEIYATIYYPRIDKYANQRIASRSQLLGHAIAHEMGHLLLGSVSHARFGIMRSEWTAEDLRSITRGALLFEAYQSILIRKAVMRRTCSQSRCESH